VTIGYGDRMRWRALIGLLTMLSLSGCDQVRCVETLEPYEKILHGLPGMLVAYAVAWAGIDGARAVLRVMEGRSGRIAGICALGIGAAGLAGLGDVYAPALLGLALACVLPILWVAPLARSAPTRASAWRIVGALACTAAAGVVLLLLGGANAMLVLDAGRICAP